MYIYTVYILMSAGILEWKKTPFRNLLLRQNTNNKVIVFSSFFAFVQSYYVYCLIIILHFSFHFQVFVWTICKFLVPTNLQILKIKPGQTGPVQTMNQFYAIKHMLALLMIHSSIINSYTPLNNISKCSLSFAK